MIISWNSIRLGSPVDGIVTKTVHKTLPGVVGLNGWWGLRVVSVGGGEVQGVRGLAVGGGGGGPGVMGTREVVGDLGGGGGEEVDV